MYIVPVFRLMPLCPCVVLGTWQARYHCIRCKADFPPGSGGEFGVLRIK